MKDIEQNENCKKTNKHNNNVVRKKNTHMGSLTFQTIYEAKVDRF